jgi:hypothetical protein
LIEPWLTGQPSVAAADEHHINTAPQSLLESDGEDELVDEDEEFDEDAIAGGSVSLHYIVSLEQADDQKITPSAKRRADQVNARKAANDERKAHITNISSKRSAVEQKKVCGHLELFAVEWD